MLSVISINKIIACRMRIHGKNKIGQEGGNDHKEEKIISSFLNADHRFAEIDLNKGEYSLSFFCYAG
jgi:hypothetical protein